MPITAATGNPPVGSDATGSKPAATTTAVATGVDVAVRVAVGGTDVDVLVGGTLVLVAVGAGVAVAVGIAGTGVGDGGTEVAVGVASPLTPISTNREKPEASPLNFTPQSTLSPVTEHEARELKPTPSCGACSEVADKYDSSHNRCGSVILSDRAGNGSCRGRGFRRTRIGKNGHHNCYRSHQRPEKRSSLYFYSISFASWHLTERKTDIATSFPMARTPSPSVTLDCCVKVISEARSKSAEAIRDALYPIDEAA
jgi:hypothetical protein